MSIGGYMPPLCDPEDGHLLLDGGYVNNVPADVMHERASGPILAHDVGARFDDEPPLYDYGDYLSGWSYQLAKLVPFSRIPRVLKPEEIQLRLGSVACYSKLREVSEADYCDLIRLPQIEVRCYINQRFASVYFLELWNFPVPCIRGDPADGISIWQILLQ